MKRTILEGYALAVCFASIVCLVISLGILVHNVIQIAHPEFTLSSYEHNRHQTNEAFWGSLGQPGIPPPANEVLTANRLESYRLAIASERRDALQALEKAVYLLLASLVVFLIHWRLARRAREAMNPV